jgi:hypothetical protein
MQLEEQLRMAPGALLWMISVMRLSAGILAVQDPSVPVDATRAAQYATAALHASDAHHVDPWELIGVARNESRFRADEVGPDGKDCGIMQTRITGSRYNCRQLRTNVKVAFMEGARELAGYSATCRTHADFDRCRFNRYNSGVRYARRGFHGHYWLRVLCFTDAARSGVAGGGCLDVQSRGAIDTAMRRNAPGRHARERLYADARIPRS